MKIVWQLEKATVRDVYEALRERRDVAYTTVMTMMKILEEKKFLKKTQVDRAYEYRPAKPAPAGRRRDGPRLPRPRLRRRGGAAARAPGEGRQAVEVGQGHHAPADAKRWRNDHAHARQPRRVESCRSTMLVAVALVAIRLLRLDAPAVRYHFLRVLLVICLALPFVQPRVDAGRAASAGASGARGAVRDTRLVVGAAGDRLQRCRSPCPMPR